MQVIFDKALIKSVKRLRNKDIRAKTARFYKLQRSVLLKQLANQQ